MRNVVRFVLSGQLEEVRDCRPTETVLDYLREWKKRTGTKEGCAEGDCGACTVVVAESENGKMTYRAMNACILFLPTLDGKQLITVEDLQSADGDLHPVQQAMVEQHGSQCGFCTPGFVMSLFSMYHDQAHNPPTRDDINTALAGNLCRCTGYLPIVNAARQSLESAAPDQFTAAEADSIRVLSSLESDEMLVLENGRQRYFAPTHLAELTEVLDQNPGATLVAGATDVGLWVTKQLEQPETLVYTGRVRELRQIVRNEAAGHLDIGAAVTYSQAMPSLLAAYPELNELLNRLGAVQVRNAGTIGGNIANGSPIGDMPPALIALDARLVLAGSDGEREIALEDYFIDYGKQDLQPEERVSRIHLPLPAGDSEFRVYKLSKRIEQDISAVCAAFLIRFDGDVVSEARVCFGGMAATPKRASRCEAAIMGRQWTLETVQTAMGEMEADFEPITDMRASAGYRMQTAQNLLRRFFIETTEPDTPARIGFVRAIGEEATA